MSRVSIARLAAFLFAVLVSAFAHATLTVSQITFNVVGLDSNTPASGPKYFPAGARVCSNVATTNVTATWVWDSVNPNINLRGGSLASIVIPAIAAGGCADAYFEVEVNQVAAAFDTARRYHVIAADGSGSASSPMPREIYVEHLVSQNRNAVTGAKVDGVAIPAGGSIALLLGNTYTIELSSGTATQGYNQFESFINFSNAIFQIQSVTTAYSANNSPNVAGPAPATSNKLYADACLWENSPASPNYRSCVGGDYKSGGSTITTTYVVKIIGGGGTSQTLSTLLYDFSGSSYHYNADFSVSSWIANIVDPAASATMSKVFAPAQTMAGGTSTLTFTLGNPTSLPLTGANFTDPFPLLSGGQMVVASPAVFSTSGCGAATFAPAAGAASVTFSNGTIAANSTCSVSVRVSVPALPVAGTYANVSGNLFIGSLDTGKSASANLGLTTTAPPAGSCGLTLAQWTMPVGNVIAPPPFSFKAPDVAAAIAAVGAGITASAIDTTIGNPANSWRTRGYSNGALVLANNDYVEFSVNTTNYNTLTFAFDARRDASLLGPASLALYSSTDGTNFTAYGSVIAPGATFTNNNQVFPGPSNPSGLTYFRIYGYNAANNGVNALLYVDNVTIGGCQSAAPPTIVKTFLTNPVAVGGTSTLQFTLTNPGSNALSGVTFSDSLPAGTQVSGSPLATTTCGGSPTWAPAPGATTLNFGQVTGATLAAGASCTASVNVIATTAGPHANVSGFVSSTEGGTNTTPTGSASATLTALQPPSITKTFSASPILVGATSLLTVTIQNPNPGNPLGGIAVTDTYPAGLVNAIPQVPAVTNTCGGAVTATPGGNGLILSGGALVAGGTCAIAVPVTAASAGTYVNVAGPISASVAGAGNTGTATLVVKAPSPAINLAKRVATSPTGPWMLFVAVAPGTPLYYQFTAENTGDVPFSPFGVTDSLLAGTGADPATCAWQTTNLPTTLPALPVGTATIDPTATCVTGPVAAILGAVTNTATAQGTFGGLPYGSNPATASYIGAVPGFSMLKQAGTSAIGPWASAIGVASGSNVFYKFTIVNIGGLDLSAFGVTDPLVSTASCTPSDLLLIGQATTCVVGPVVAAGANGSTTSNTATAHGTNVSLFTTPPSTASYTISTATADLAIAKTDGVINVYAGGSTAYTLTVTNNGPAEVTGATVVDVAPPGMTFGAWTCAVANPGSGGLAVTACGAANGIGDLNTTATMKPGAVITYSVAATVAAAATGTIVNAATVTAPVGTFDPIPANNTASDTNAIDLVADLAITKSNGSVGVTSGATTTYTITAANNGPSNVTGAILVDAAVAGLAKTGVVCSATPGQCLAPPSVAQLESGAFALPPLANGATYQIVVAADVTGSSGIVANTATIALPVGIFDPAPGNNSSTDSDPVNVVADLAILKSDGTASVNAGASTVYTISVINNGPSSITGAVLADPTAAGLSKTAIACSAIPGVCIAAPTIAELEGGSFALPPLANGATYQIAVTAYVTAGNGTVTNTTTIATPVGANDPSPGDNVAFDTDAVIAAADLAVSKTGTLNANSNGAVSYTLVVTNNGPSAADGAILTDPVVANFTATGVVCGVPIGGAACPGASTLAALQGAGIVIPTLPSGGSVTFTHNGTAAAGGNITNTATVAAPVGITDSNPANNSSIANTAITATVADIVIVKSGAATVNGNGAVSYSLVVTNNGPSAADAAVVANPVVANFTATGVSCGGAIGGAACPAASTLAALQSAGIVIPTLPSGGSVTFTLNGTAAAAGNITSTATVAAPAGTTDNNPANNSSAATTTITSTVADLAITKTNGMTSLKPGGNTTYTITVTNNGPAEVTGATVTDLAPAGLTFHNWTCAVSNAGSGGVVVTACGSPGGSGSINATVTLKVGAVITFMVPATAAANATGTIVNVATVNPPLGITALTPANSSASDSDIVANATSGVVASIPTLEPLALGLLILLLGAVSARHIGSRRAARDR